MRLIFNCRCNQVHPDFVNNTCTTDIDCQRVVVYTDNVITLDHQLCVPTDEIRNPCDYAEKHVGTYVKIEVGYCCRKERCNGNDSLLEEFIKKELGMFV